MENAVLLTVQQVADQLGITKYQVYRRIVRGDIPAVQARRGNIHYLVAQSDLDDYIAAGGADLLTNPKIDNLAMLRVSDVARMTGFTVETIRRMCYEGRLPFVKGNGDRGHLRIPRAAIEELLGNAK